MDEITLVFLDTETTSLRHDRRAWEVGLIQRRYVRLEDGGLGHEEDERQWFIYQHQLDLGNADLMSLKIGRFHDRHPFYAEPGSDEPDAASEFTVLVDVERLTRGAFIVGAVPWFDTDVLGQRMRAHGICPSWHYHLVDVEALAAGAIGLEPRWRFDDLLAEYKLTYEEADRHTAIGDARMVRDLYDAVMNREPRIEASA